jgi:hypothetical protein
MKLAGLITWATVATFKSTKQRASWLVVMAAITNSFEPGTFFCNFGAANWKVAMSHAKGSEINLANFETDDFVNSCCCHLTFG